MSKSKIIKGQAFIIENALVQEQILLTQDKQVLLILWSLLKIYGMTLRQKVHIKVIKRKTTFIGNMK